MASRGAIGHSDAAKINFLAAKSHHVVIGVLYHRIIPFAIRYLERILQFGVMIGNVFSSSGYKKLSGLLHALPQCCTSHKKIALTSNAVHRKRKKICSVAVHNDRWSAGL